MNAPKFSPGPWTTHEIMNSTEGVVLIESADDCIARVLVIDDSDLANARLIAAAPELYGTLKQIVIECTESPNCDAVRLETILSQARAALAKAVQP